MFSPLYTCLPVKSHSQATMLPIILCHLNICSDQSRFWAIFFIVLAHMWKRKRNKTMIGQCNPPQLLFSWPYLAYLTYSSMSGFSSVFSIYRIFTEEKIYFVIFRVVTFWDEVGTNEPWIWEANYRIYINSQLDK